MYSNNHLLRIGKAIGYPLFYRTIKYIQLLLGLFNHFGNLINYFTSQHDLNFVRLFILPLILDFHRGKRIFNPSITSRSLL